MSWKAPKIAELPVDLEIQMYACAVRKEITRKLGA